MQYYFRAVVYAGVAFDYLSCRESTGEQSAVCNLGQ